MELYHVTKSENVADIMKNGLVPSIGKYATEMGETQKAVWLFPRLEDAQRRLSTLEEQLANAQQEVGKPFPQEQGRSPRDWG